MVVVGSSRRGRVGRIFAGGVAERLLTGASCAVAVAPRGYRGTDGFGRIAVAYDGSTESREALGAAMALAFCGGGAIHSFTVVEPFTWSSGIAGAGAGELRAAAPRPRGGGGPRGARPRAEGIAVRSEVLWGRAAEELTSRSGAFDLLVCGSRGYGPVRSVVLGSVSRALVSHAACPVLVMPREPAAGHRLRRHPRGADHLSRRAGQAQPAASAAARLCASSSTARVTALLSPAPAPRSPASIAWTSSRSGSRPSEGATSIAAATPKPWVERAQLADGQQRGQRVEAMHRAGAAPERGGVDDHDVRGAPPSRRRAPSRRPRAHVRRRSRALRARAGAAPAPARRRRRAATRCPPRRRASAGDAQPRSVSSARASARIAAASSVMSIATGRPGDAPPAARRSGRRGRRGPGSRRRARRRTARRGTRSAARPATCGAGRAGRGSAPTVWAKTASPAVAAQAVRCCPPGRPPSPPAGRPPTRAPVDDGVGAQARADHGDTRAGASQRQRVEAVARDDRRVGHGWDAGRSHVPATLERLRPVAIGGTPEDAAVMPHSLRVRPDALRPAAAGRGSQPRRRPVAENPRRRCGITGVGPAVGTDAGHRATCDGGNTMEREPGSAPTGAAGRVRAPLARLARRAAGENRARTLVAVAAAAIATGGALHVLGAAAAGDRGGRSAVALLAAELAYEVARTVVVDRHLGVDAIALVAMVGALALDQLLAGAVIGLMFSGGEALEAAASPAGAPRAHGADPAGARPPRTCGSASAWRTSRPARSRREMSLVVRTGEVIPVDGTVVGAEAVVDTSTLTGEPLPVTLRGGMTVLSGTRTPARRSTCAPTGPRRTARMPRWCGWSSARRRARAARADRRPLRRVFLPVALAIAGVAWAISGDAVRGLAVVVVATPCPLILAAPIALASGLSARPGPGSSSRAPARSRRSAGRRPSYSTRPAR